MTADDTAEMAGFKGRLQAHMGHECICAEDLELQFGRRAIEDLETLKLTAGRYSSGAFRDMLIGKGLDLDYEPATGKGSMQPVEVDRVFRTLGCPLDGPGQLTLLGKGSDTRGISAEEDPV